MLKINERYEVDRFIFDCVYIRCTPKSLKNVNTDNTQAFIHIPTEDSVISIKDCYIELDFKVTHNAAPKKD